jgi:peptidoglycan/LPS O-acetylase OafA/YrhL
MGVDLFFALSSYLITELLLREIKQTGKIHLKYFYARRVLRIWPVYGLVLFLGIVLIPALGISGRIPPVFIAGYIFFAGNWSCAFLGSPAVLFTIGPLWSISIEEQFYLLWPLSIQRLGVKHLKWLCAGLLVSAELGRLFMCLLNAPANMRYFSTFTHLDPIAWGALLALVTKDRALRPSVPLRALIGMGCVGIILLALLYEDGSAGYVSDLLITPMYGFCCAAIIFLVLQSQFLAVKPLPYLGKISFGLYAYHAMILVMMDKFVAQGSWVKLLMIPTKLLVTIAVAALSYKFLEAPILKFKERFTLVQSRPV